MRNKKTKYFELYERLKEFQDEHGYAPSVREFAVLSGTPSTSVANFYLERLVTLGLIERDPGISRGIRLVRANSMRVSQPIPINKKRLPDAKRRFKAGIAAHGVRVWQARSRQVTP